MRWKSFVTLTIVLSYLFLSCQVTEFDCGVVDTSIVELSSSVGSYASPNYSAFQSTDFIEAAIRIEVSDIRYSENINSCEFFTPEPSLIESINITATSPISFQGQNFLKGDILNSIFKVSEYLQVDSDLAIAEFIKLQRTNPLVFYKEGDGIILQLKDQPHAGIYTTFMIELEFSDSSRIVLDTPNFEVMN